MSIKNLEKLTKVRGSSALARLLSMNIPSTTPLDPIDQTIVNCLLRDGRMSIPAIAEAAGIGRATAYSRFDRLCDAGVIRGFRAEVDPEKIGLGVCALAFLRVDQHRWQETSSDLAALAGVEWVGLAAGEHDVIVLLRAANLHEMRDVVLRDLQSVPGVIATQTSVLLDEIRPG